MLTLPDTSWSTVDIGGSRGRVQRTPPLRVQILSFRHTKFSKRNRLGSWHIPYEVDASLREILDPPLVDVQICTGHFEESILSSCLWLVKGPRYNKLLRISFVFKFIHAMFICLQRHALSVWLQESISTKRLQIRILRQRKVTGVCIDTYVIYQDFFFKLMSWLYELLI